MQIRGKEKKKDREWLDAEDEKHSGGLEQISVGEVVIWRAAL